MRRWNPARLRKKIIERGEKYAEIEHDIRMVNPDLRITREHLITWSKRLHRFNNKTGRIMCPNADQLMALADYYGCVAEDFFDFYPPEFMMNMFPQTHGEIRLWPEWARLQMGGGREPDILVDEDVPELHYVYTKRPAKYNRIDPIVDPGD